MIERTAMKISSKNSFDRLMQYLPHHYKNMDAPIGTSIKVMIVGDGGGSWIIKRNNLYWEFGEEDTENVVYIDQHIGEILFLDEIDINEIRQYWQITGNHELGSHALRIRYKTYLPK